MADSVCGKTPNQWKNEISEVNDIANLKETLWINPKLKKAANAIDKCSLKSEGIKDAQARLKRFAPLFVAAFPETKETGGIIESPIIPLPTYEQRLKLNSDTEFLGKMFVKCDCHLPISGSIKARGGIYEVLTYAESLALDSGMLKIDDDYSILLSEKFSSLFSGHSVAAGSTGNLGLSIGIMGAKFGFQTTIHMSHDAKQWKKDLLRKKGVEVIEHKGDYSIAVNQARKTAASNCYFIDDENSQTLFLGYSVAALRLKNQLNDLNIAVDAEHPLFVYLPCGVGGGPGGVAFGLKQVFGDYVHCFFAEPTHSACMMLGLATECHNLISVQDFGIDNLTCADGLAVGRPSGFVGKLIQPFLDGCYTVSDQHLYDRLRMLADVEDLWLEPSAVAGFFGPNMLADTPAGQEYLTRFSKNALKNATHIAWATGGGMVPDGEMKEYYEKGIPFTE